MTLHAVLQDDGGGYWVARESGVKGFPLLLRRGGCARGAVGVVRPAEASQTLTTPTALCAATPPQEEGNPFTPLSNGVTTLF